jgi:predicted dienelactone hydrolase
VIQAAAGSRLVAAAKTLAVLLAALGFVVGCSPHAEQLVARPARTASPARSATTRPTASPARPTASATPTAAVAGAAGTYAISEREITFTEPAHEGPTGESLGQRTLPTEIWYPRASRSAGSPARGPFPLLVFAPGFLKCAGTYADLMESWAGAGYVVAAVNFPRTNCDLGEEAYEPDLVNQPQDLSYVLTRLLALNAQPGNPLSGLLNPGEVAAAGQSDGGDTVAALAANTCCTDHRLKAVAVLSGAEWPPMPGRYFARETPPMLFVQGSADTINPPWTSVQLYSADHEDARYYLDLFGATHMEPYSGTNQAERLVAQVTLEFFDRYVLGQSGAAAAMTRDGNVSGAAALVGGGQPPP